jgi:hypothetical protein
VNAAGGPFDATLPVLIKGRVWVLHQKPQGIVPFLLKLELHYLAYRRENAWSPVSALVACCSLSRDLAGPKRLRVVAAFGVSARRRGTDPEREGVYVDAQALFPIPGFIRELSKCFADLRNNVITNLSPLITI